MFQHVRGFPRLSRRLSRSKDLSDLPFRLLPLHKRQMLGVIATISLIFLVVIIGIYSSSDHELFKKRGVSSFASLTDDELERFLKIGLTADDNLRSAIRAAASRSYEPTTVALASLTDHPNFLVRVEVARALGKANHLSHEHGLAAAGRLLHDHEYLVRSFAARSLAGTSSDHARALLKRALLEERHEIVRFAITKALISGDS